MTTVEQQEDIIPMVSQPNMARNLYPHQLSAIHMMENRETKKTIKTQVNENYTSSMNTNLGIYSDITGYGKTLGMIGLIVRDNMSWDVHTPYEHQFISYSHGRGNIMIMSVKKYHRLDTTLIVAGPSIMKQWSDELLHTNLKTGTVTSKKLIEKIDVNQYDVILCSPSMYNKFTEKWENYAWKRFVFDEPTHVKIPAMKSIIAGFYWFITATPEQLLYRTTQNRRHFVGSLFGYNIHTDIFRKLIVKNDDNFVKQSYTIPQTNHINYECYQPMYNMVRGLVTDQVAEMISAGNIEGAVTSLGGNKTSNIVELIKRQINEDIDEANLKITKYTRRGVGYEDQLSEWKEKKAKLDTKLNELDNRFKDILNGTCNICFDKYDKPVMLSCCQNIFCGQCIFKWMERKNTCPLCRQPVSLKDIIYISDKDDSRDSIITHEHKKKTKPDTVAEIIGKNKDGKFIVFSAYDEGFSSISRSLDVEDIKYGHIIGHKTTRERILNSFKKGDVQVIFLNSNSNGAGINLQECTDIILYHEMDESQSTQILGRANRIGRSTSLNVHHLI